MFAVYVCKHIRCVHVYTIDVSMYMIWVKKKINEWKCDYKYGDNVISVKYLV